MRLAFLLKIPISPDVKLSIGYLWTGGLSVFFEDEFVLSFIVSYVCVLALSFCLYQLNSSYALIRVRTYLVFPLVLFLLSLFYDLAFLIPQYVSLLLIFFSVYILFSMYQKSKISGSSFVIGFFLGLASLFDLGSLFFLPVFLLGLRMMRVFSMRSFLAFCLGLFSVYWVLLACVFLFNDLDRFLISFLDFNFTTVFKPSSLDLAYLLNLIFILILGFVLFFAYQSNSFKDKIRIRTNIMFLYVVFSYAYLLSFIFLSVQSLGLLVLLTSLSMLLAHFVSLATANWKIFFFYLICIVCCIVYSMNFYTV